MPRGRRVRRGYMVLLSAWPRHARSLPGEFDANRPRASPTRPAATAASRTVVSPASVVSVSRFHDDNEIPCLARNAVPGLYSLIAARRLATVMIERLLEA